MIDYFINLILVKNKVNFLTELQKIDGINKFEEFKKNFPKNLLNYFNFVFVLIILCFAIDEIYICQIKYMITFQIINLFLISNLFSIYLYHMYSILLVESFIIFCKEVVKFEDYAKCIIKINKNKTESLNNNLNKSLLTIIRTFENLFEYKNTSDVNEKNTKKNKMEINQWDNYLKHKYENFKNLFLLYDENFHKSKFYLVFPLVVLKVRSLINHLNKLSHNIKINLELIKNSISDVDHSDTDLENILTNLTKNDTNLIFMDQISELVINNNKLNSEYLHILQALQQTNTKDNIIVDKLELIIESKFNTINIIKQIKSNFINQNKIQDEFRKIDLLEGEDKKYLLISELDLEYKKTNNGLSLFDIEFSHTSNKAEQVREEKMRNVNNNNNTSTVSHFEIMRRADDTRRLQTNLLFDLEEFQFSKNKDSFTLEEALNN